MNLFRQLLGSSAGLRIYIYPIAATVFIASVYLTTPYFWADAADYVDSVTDFHRGKYYDFWEFGHLLWRPLGWLVWTTFFDLSDPYLWRYQIFKVFQWFNLAAGFGSTLLMAYILRRIGVRDLINLLIVAAFVSSHAFLNFTQTGTSYVTALFFYILGIAFLIERESRRHVVVSMLGGAALALSAGFWIAFVWTVPAAIFAAPVLFGFSRQNLLRAAAALVSFSSTIVLMFGAAVIILEHKSVSEVQAWVASAAHGIDTSGVARSVFGVARSFVFIEAGGIQFKRFIMGDPFNAVSWEMLLSSSLLLFLGFWAIVAVLLFEGTRLKADHIRFFYFFLICSIPVLAFGVLFDGGAVERYLPLFPAAFLLTAIVKERCVSKPLHFFLAAGLSVFVVINLFSLSLPKTNERIRSLEQRTSSIDTHVAPGDVVFLLNWNDELVNFNRSFPFHPHNLGGNRVYHVIATPGVRSSSLWHRDFAERTKDAWEKGHKVWISTRALAETPEANWNWVEGDDPRLSWTDFYHFFGELETGPAFGGQDGWVLIPASSRNIAYIERFTNGDAYP